MPFLLLVLVLSLCGCAPRHCDFSPWTCPGWDMPKVAIIPVFDSSCTDLKWNVSDEVTQFIRRKTDWDRNLFVLDEEPTFRRVLETRHISLETTCGNIWYLFGKASFVALIEIIEHNFIPYERQINPEKFSIEGIKCNTTLMIKARLVLLDVRQHKPVIFLEEIVKSSQTIPKDWEFWDYNKYCPGTDCYENSPVRRAHYRLAEVITNRIQNILWEIP